MARISLAGWKDPVRRPRYIIWAGVAVLVLAAVMVTALGVTSTYWFCANGCHKVQDDTIIAYDRSSHSNISCMACHMPVNSDPITFMLHKAEALGELYLTATNKYHLPLNDGSHVGLDGKHMGSEQCTQCHNLATRPITTSPGIIIDHDVHIEAEVHCTVCHNRVAHREDFDLTLIHPVTGEPNRKHEDFMLMQACFRCHTLTDQSISGIVAPGACTACHTPDFTLKPESHFAEDFYPSGHAELAKTDIAAMEAAGGGGQESEGSSEEATPTDEGADDQSSFGIAAAYAAEGEAPGEDAPMYQRLAHLPKAAEVGYCSTCHVVESFCNGCHGMEMPHPTEFKTKTHGEIGKENPASCELCHTGPRFCDDCHHPGSTGTQSWQFEHAPIAKETEAEACFQCHIPTYCSACHVRLNR